MADLTETLVTYYCPICGIELARSDFDRPQGEYYCPFCSSQQAPQPLPSKAGW